MEKSIGGTISMIMMKGSRGSVDRGQQLDGERAGWGVRVDDSS